MVQTEDSTPVTNGEFSEHLKEFEKIDEMVFEHEDILGTLINCLQDEPSLSEDARLCIRGLYELMYKKNSR